MTRYFTFVNDTSNKFWQITTDGNAYTVTFGRIGTAGQSQTKTIESPDRCQQEADKLIREKTGKGYVESVDGVAVTAAAPAAEKPVAPRANPDKEALETVLNRYDEIIQNTLTDQLLTFLQRVDKQHYPALKKAIKQAKRHWCDYAVLGTETRNGVVRDRWDYRGTWDQRLLVSLSGLALLSLPELKGFDGIYAFVAGRQKAAVARSLLAWAKPVWLAEFLLQQTNGGSWSTIPYTQLRELESAGLVGYQPELFARSMALFHENIFLDNSKVEQDYQTYVDFLATDALVLTRELPVLFDYPIPIHESFGTIRKKKNQYDRVYIWPLVFARLLADGKLDRAWFLEQCLSVQTKDWNINLRAFYRKQIEATDPSPAEWLSLQPTLLPLLAAQHPHVVNWASGIIKQISTEPDFRPAEMLDWVSAVLMRNDCKTALKTLLAMMERLLKTHPAHQTTITHLLADVFVINDLSLQTKAAALLAKYGDLADTDLRNRLQSYAGQMLGTVQTALVQFMGQSVQNAESDSGRAPAPYTYRPKNNPKLWPQNRVQLPATWNDLLFQIGEFIGSTQPLDAELLMNALIKLPADTPADFRDQLKPYQKQLQNKHFPSLPGYFLREYLLHWMSGSDTAFVIPSTGDVMTLQLQADRIMYLDRKRKSHSALPMLSLPSHAPYWLAPIVLVDRLLDYQHANEPVETIDLAIAIARMPREETTDAITRCRELNEPLSSLMRYCLGESDQIILPSDRALNRLLSIFNQKSTTDDLTVLWAVAARTYNPDSIFTQFNKTPFAHVPNVAHAFVPDITIEVKWAEWTNYSTNEIRRGPSYQALQSKLPPLSKQHSALLYSLDLFEQSKPVDYAYFSITSADVLYWRGLIPQQPEALYAIILKYICPTPAESGNMSQALSLMLMPSFVIRQTSMLVLACGLLARNKQISIVGAEVLIYRFGKQTIDATRLGDRLGWLLAGNYAPIQRLTDALNLVRDVSPLHNKALAMLLEGLFAQLMPLPEPPKNTRKLLEIYLDLLIKLTEPPSQPTTFALTNWQKTASLKKLCIDILKLS